MTYGYNGNNLLTSKTDAKGQAFIYSYDAYNRPVSVSLGGQALRTYYYDSNPLDSAHTFSANALGRLAAIGYAAGAAGQVAEWFSYTQAGAVGVKRLQFTQAYSPGVNVTANLDASYAYDGEGGLTSVAYPSGPTYAYGYDTLHRLSTLTDQSNHLQRVNTVSYNADGQWAGLTYFGDAETRTYNNLGQLTRILIPNIFQEDYRFPAGTDNGKVSSIATYPSGEEVTYQYDSFNRLIAATTTAASDAAGVRPWGERFGYDGFGNLTRKTVTKGTAAALSIAVDGATNRVSGASYDANGNALTSGTQQLSYDAENRLAAVSQYGTQQVAYVYDGSNRRIWRGTYASNGTLTAQEAYFYGVDGRKLGTYFLAQYYQASPLQYALNTTLTETRTYFGSKLVAVNGQAFVSDRLGSLRNNVTFYPYGDEKSNNAPNDAVKFATYTRDGVTGLDYAVNRYYASGLGRFMTPDPLQSNASIVNPQSWNRYSYVGGDPTNLNDPKGLCWIAGTQYEDGMPPCPDVQSVTVDGGFDLMALLGFTGGTLSIDGFITTPSNVLFGGFSKATLKEMGECNRLLGSAAHAILGIAGLTPGLGAIANGMDSLLYLSDEDYTNAGLSLAAMVPMGGDFALAEKFGPKVLAAAETIEKWLGEGYQIIVTNSGRDLYLTSKDATKRIGFDLTNFLQGQGPHVNIEEWLKDARYPGDNTMRRVRNVHVCPEGRPKF